MSTADSQPPKIPRTGPIASDRLDSWKEIAAYLNRDVRTVQRWEETAGLPVCRLTEGRVKGSPVYAYKSELEKWLRQSVPTSLETEPQSLPTASSGWSPRRVAWVVLLVLGLAAAGAAVWRLARSSPSTQKYHAKKLTKELGLSQYPSVSPDEQYVVFSWNGKKQDNFDLYITHRDGGEPRRLTDNPALDGWPVWSPKGDTIAFARYFFGTPRAEIWTVPANGGGEDKIGDFRLPAQSGTEVEYFPAMCWTPDSRFLIGPDSSAGPNAPTRLVLKDIHAHEDRPLVTPVAGSAGDRCPAITPDGRRLAFLRSTKGRVRNVYYVPLGADYRPRGEPIQLTDEPSGAANPMWKGDEVLYVTIRDGARTLWRVSYDDPLHPRLVESVGPIGSTLAISQCGKTLVYSDDAARENIWRLDLAGGKDVTPTMSTRANDRQPEFAPDGRQIAIVSDREGQPQIWVFPSESGRPISLPPILGSQPSTPHWSPDSEQIAYQCENQGNDDVCTIPAKGGKVHTVTNNRARDISPSWSLDGQWVYFTSNRSSSYQVWKAPANGTDADAQQLTRGGGLHPVESVNGNVYFARETSPATVWQIPRGGGEEKRVGDFEILGCGSQNFAVGSEGIYYTSTTDPEHWFEVWLYKFATGKSNLIQRIKKRYKSGLSVSPDGRWSLFAAFDVLGGDLYLVENFR